MVADLIYSITYQVSLCLPNALKHDILDQCGQLGLINFTKTTWYALSPKHNTFRESIDSHTHISIELNVV